MIIDIPYVIFIVVLLIIILYLLFERASIVEQSQKEKDKLLDELSKAIKAVIAKNANEYVMTTSIDKVPTEKEPDEEEDQEIPVETLSDDDFDKALGIERKAPKK